MWYLSDVVLTLFLDQVLKAKQISTNACQFVSTLFQKAAHDTRTLIGDETSNSRAWDRFSAVAQFTDMSLADLQVGLSDGVFRSVTGPELSRLIVATFKDTRKRQQVLDLLASH
jgi:centromere/kinetochore protein ZW10